MIADLAGVPLDDLDARRNARLAQAGRVGEVFVVEQVERSHTDSGWWKPSEAHPPSGSGVVSDPGLPGARPR